MRAHRIVVLPPILDYGLRLDPVSEPFHGQAYIPEFPVEAFRRTILPRLVRIDQHRFDTLINDPFQQCRTDKDVFQVGPTHSYERTSSPLR